MIGAIRTTARNFAKRSLSATLAAMLLVLPACTTQTDRIGADDGTDVCRRERVTLDSTGDFFAEDIIKGAAIGAVGGGLIGGLAGGDLKGALIGAAAGGALGAAGGYFKARMQQSTDQASLYRTVSSDIQRDNDNIDKTQIAFNQLVDCRKRSADRIRADLRAGRITRADAQGQMADVKRRAAEDLQIARKISARIQDRGTDFEFANNQVNPSAAKRPPARPANPTAHYNGPPATPAAVQAATSTNLAKRDRFNHSIDTAAASQSTFELS